MKHLRNLLLVLVTGCATDLTLPSPPGQGPPHPAGVSLASAYAGETVVVTGTELGTAASATVRIGGKRAEIVSGAAGTLAVLVPDELPTGTPLDVTVATDGGEATLAGALRFLGPGHPRGLVLRGDAFLGAEPSWAWATEDIAYVLDRTHGTQVPVHPLFGFTLGAPVRVGTDPVASYGSATSQWVYSIGGVGAHPRLARVEWQDGEGRRTCDTGELKTIGDPSHPIEMYRASASDEALLLAAPVGNRQVLVVRGDACPPAPQVLPMGDTVAGLVVAGDEVIVGLTDRFLRIRPNGELVRGEPSSDEFAAPGNDGLFALDAARRRVAYLRADGDIGFASWDAEGGAVHVEESTLLTYQQLHTLAFGAPDADGAATRLYLAVGDRILVYDAAVDPPALLGTTELKGVHRLQSLPDGELLALTFTGTALLTSEGTLLRIVPLDAQIPEGQSLAMTREGRPVVLSYFGAASFQPDLSLFELTYRRDGPVETMDGLAGSHHDPVAFRGTTLFRYDAETHDFLRFSELPAGRTILHAASDEDGTHLAAAATDASGWHVDVATKAGVKTLDLPGIDRARVLFAADALFVLTQAGREARLLQVDPDTLEIRRTTPLALPGSLANPSIRIPRWSRALGAVVVSVPDLRVRGDGTTDAVSTLLFAVRPDGTVLASPPPLTGGIAEVVGLSPDGRMLVATNPRRGSVDTAFLAEEAGALVVRPGPHQELSSHAAGNVAFSTDGASLYLALPIEDSLILLQ